MRNVLVLGGRSHGLLALGPLYLTVPNNLKLVIDNRDTMVQLLKRKKHTHLSFYYSYPQNPFEKKKKGEESSLHLCMYGKFTSYINQCHTTLTQAFFFLIDEEEEEEISR